MVQNVCDFCCFNRISHRKFQLARQFLTDAFSSIITPSSLRNAATASVFEESFRETATITLPSVEIIFFNKPYRTLNLPNNVLPLFLKITAQRAYPEQKTTMKTPMFDSDKLLFYINCQYIQIWQILKILSSL